MTTYDLTKPTRPPPNRMNQALARSLGSLNAFLAILMFFAIGMTGVVTGVMTGLRGELDYGGMVGAMVGAVVGFVVAWIVVVLVFGTLAVLLNIRDLLANVRDLLEQTPRG